jgi:hypothetical protein
MERIARDIMRLAAELSASRRLEAMEFATPAALEKYLEKHPKADRSRHTVKQKKDGEKAKGPAKEKPGAKKDKSKGDGKLQGDDNPFGMSEGRVSEIRDKYGAQIKKIREAVKWEDLAERKKDFEYERSNSREYRDQAITEYEKASSMSPEEYLKDKDFGFGKWTKKEIQEELDLVIKDGFLEKGATPLDLAEHSRDRFIRWSQDDADEMGVSTPQEYYKTVAAREIAAMDYAEKQWDSLSAPERIAVVAAPKAAELFEKDLKGEAKKMHEKMVEGWVNSSASPEGHQLHGLLESLGAEGQRSERDKGEGGRTDEDCDPKCVEKNRKEGAESSKLREYVEEAYAYTQAFYREMGVSEITLWRGTASQADGMDVGEEIDIETREASSWSTSASVAARFGRVIEMKVPVENVFIGGASARDFAGEQEVVVLGASGLSAKVDAPDAHAQTFNKEASRMTAARKKVKMTDDDDDWIRKKPKSTREIREEMRNRRRGRGRKSFVEKFDNSFRDSGTTRAKGMKIMDNRKIAGELVRLARELSAARVELGRTVMTRSVSMDMREDDDFERLVKKSLARHRRGDWGELDRSDAKMNDAALKSGEDRLFSVYEGGPEGKFWIITEWDRSVTTILYPSDY